MRIDNPIRIGEALRGVLLASSAITAIIGDEIHAYTTRKEVNDPHVVYDGVTVTYSESKDGCYADTAELYIRANTCEYAQGVDLASAIVDTLLEYDNISIGAVDCDYNDSANMYVHNISITIQL